MTIKEPMFENHDCGGDAAAYALGALEPPEAEAFRRHLESCAVCRDELAAFRRVVDALPMAAPQQPVPRRLRRRVMRAMPAEAHPRLRHKKRPRRPVLSGHLVWRRAFAVGALAAAAVALVAGLELSSGGSSGPRVIQARVIGSTGNAEVRVSGARAELIVTHLQPPPAGRIYEVWIRRSDRPPAPTHALFGVTSSGAADVGVPGSVRGVTVIMVTQEPAGGSRVPTHPPVIVARLT